jgi:hypothetical protein
MFRKPPFSLAFPVAIGVLLALALVFYNPKPGSSGKAEAEKDNGHSYHFKDKSGDYDTDISVSKTATGAVAKYELPVSSGHTRAVQEVNLSAEEWENFINAIQELGVMEWEYSYYGVRHCVSKPSWEVKIVLPGRVKFIHGNDAYPPNWDEFIKLMTDIKKRTSRELESRLKAEYEKRFKKPITEQELTTEQVRFRERLNKTGIYSFSKIIITRTATGAIVNYIKVNYKEYSDYEEVRISTEDWLDFINALYKSPFMSWDKTRFGNGRLDIYNSNNLKPQKYEGYNKNPPGWGKFIKVINDIRAKAKKDSATVKAESELKTGYKKRFGKPISDFELYAKSMEFHADSRLINNTVHIRLDRTGTGAFIKYEVNKQTLLKAELSAEEWMDFLNNLKTCPANEQNKLYICCRKNLNDDSILEIKSRWSIEIESSGDADIFDTDARNLCVPKWDEFMEIVNSKSVSGHKYSRGVF